MDGVGPKGIAVLLCEESTGSQRNGWLFLKGTLHWEKSTGPQTHGSLNLKGTHSQTDPHESVGPKGTKETLHLSDVTVSAI